MARSIHGGLAYWEKRSTRARASTFSSAIRSAVFERDGNRCVYCGEYGDSVDHVFPVKWGGPAIQANAVTACRACNGRKSGRLKIDLITRGFYYLMTVGEDMSWTEKAGGKISTLGRRERE